MNDSIFAMRIARQLSRCEHGTDQLIIDTAGLVSEMASARLETETFGTGQRAMSRVIDAQRALVSAQTDLIRAHADLLKIGEERGDMLIRPCPPAQERLDQVA